MDGSATDDEREEELSTIVAIFPEIQADPLNPFVVSLEIPVELSAPLAVAFSSAPESAAPKAIPTPPSSGRDDKPVDDIATVLAVQHEVHHLQYFPPLNLQVTLPEGYPANKPPQIRLSAALGWLSPSQLHSLEMKGEQLWEEYGHGQMVFAYIDFIQQAAERAFDIPRPDEVPVKLPGRLKTFMLDFDKVAQRKKFDQGTYDCGVCLEPKKGSACHRMRRCGHVFCVACLRDFYNNAIKEGDVATVRCLDPTCGDDPIGTPRRKKKLRTLGPNELLQIPLEHSAVKRYVELKRKKKLESDKNTIYCPRKWCQGPARSKKYPKITSLDQYESSDSEPEDDSQPSIQDAPKRQYEDRLSICEDCEFAFCRVCLAGWHGDLVRCWPRSREELSEEEQASYNYIRSRTSPCPTCNSPSQKIMGCNHMTCFQCRTHYCYLCTAWLDPNNPYEHFNTATNKCFMRLWDLEEGDEGQEVRFEGARGAEIAAMAAAQQEAAALEAAAAAAREAQNAAPAVDRANGAADGNHVNGNGVPPGAPAEAPPEQPLAVAFNQLQLDPVPPPPAPPNAAGRGRGQRGRGGAARGNARGRGRGRGNAGGGRGGIPANPGIQAAADEALRRGLRRFLQMAANDEEDEWDSDELEGDDADFEAMELIR